MLDDPFTPVGLQLGEERARKQQASDSILRRRNTPDHEVVVCRPEGCGSPVNPGRRQQIVETLVKPTWLQYARLYRG